MLRSLVAVAAVGVERGQQVAEPAEGALVARPFLRQRLDEADFCQTNERMHTHYDVAREREGGTLLLRVNFVRATESENEQASAVVGVADTAVSDETL